LYRQIDHRERALGVARARAIDASAFATVPSWRKSAARTTESARWSSRSVRAASSRAHVILREQREARPS
jgi:hypothetical protein